MQDTLKRTLYVLDGFMNDTTGTAFPSVRTIAARRKVTERTVQNHLRRLKELGLIVSSVRVHRNRRQTTNLYEAAYAHPFTSGVSDTGARDHATKIFTPLKVTPTGNYKPLNEMLLNKELQPVRAGVQGETPKNCFTFVHRIGCNLLETSTMQPTHGFMTKHLCPSNVHTWAMPKPSDEKLRCTDCPHVLDFYRDFDADMRAHVLGKLRASPEQKAAFTVALDAALLHVRRQHFGPYPIENDPARWPERGCSLPDASDAIDLQGLTDTRPRVKGKRGAG